jgi:hypothetical protein
MRWQKYLAAVFVVLGSVVGGYVVSLYSPWGATPQEGHPPIVDCSYDAETETATLVVQEERYVDEEFEEVWVLVDGQPATIRRGDRRGEVNETDPDTTTTGLWVHDGNITDVADYPVGPEESVTVFDVAPDSHVRIVLVAERTGGADLGFDAEPISENCVLDSQRAGLSSPN